MVNLQKVEEVMLEYDGYWNIPDDDVGIAGRSFLDWFQLITEERDHLWGIQRKKIEKASIMIRQKLLQLFFDVFCSINYSFNYSYDDNSKKNNNDNNHNNNNNDNI